MFRYHQLADSQRAHIGSLRGVIVVLLGVIAALWIGWHNAPKQITVHIPPDLRAGSVHGIDQIPDYSIYVFAHYIFQQLNRWQQDGSIDFGKRIYALSPYLTPRYQTALLSKNALRGEGGQLENRIRAVQLVPGRGYRESRVQVLDHDTWVVSLDLELIEAAHGMIVKNPVIRYPLRVVRWQVDPEENPWGLALDGYQEKPSRVSSVDIAAHFSERLP